jgi:phosphatidylglycerol---prolipoprotein diacylglyceryl transferase
MYPYLRVGPYLLQLPGLALLAGVWIGFTLIEKESARLKVDTRKITNTVFYGLIAGLIGARLGYALQFLDIYLSNPLSLFSFKANTLSPELGILIGLIVTFVLGGRYQLALRPTLDALAPGLAVFMIALGVAHILSGDAYGAPTRLPWSIFLWADYRHPSQIYETVAAMGIFLVAMRRLFGSQGAGLNFLFIVAASAVARIFLEAFRGDSVVWPGGFRAAQVIGLSVLAVSIIFMRKWSNTNMNTETERALEV